MRSSKSLKIAFLMSLFVHGFLLAVLFWSSLGLEHDASLDSVEIALIESIASRSQPSTDISPSKEKRVSVKTVRDLFVRNNFSGTEILKRAEQSPHSEYSDISRALNPHGNQGVAEIRQNRSIWNDIFISIERPQFLEEYNHEGQVVVKFEVDAQGRLIESSLRACADDNVLKVLSVRSIRKALKIENSHKKIAKHYIANFNWTKNCEVQNSTGIQSLNYCIKTQAKKRTFSKTEKAVTYLKSLHYGFGAIEEIKKYHQEESRRETEFSPFENLKNSPDWNLSC